MNSAMIIVSTVMSSIGAIALIVFGVLLLRQCKTMNGKALCSKGWAYALIVLGALLALTTWMLKIAAVASPGCACSSGHPQSYGYYRYNSYQ
jgi:hypothetical protein